MTQDAASLTNPKDNATSNAEIHACGSAAERFNHRLGVALAEHRADVDTLSGEELSDLEERLWERLSPVVNDVAAQWCDSRATLPTREGIDRELRRRIVADRDRLQSQYECEGCSHRHWCDDNFITYHGLLLCDGCRDHARDLLRDLQRPLIAAFESEPTLERARALGFELIQGDNGLIWASDDHDIDGGSHPYADEQDALADLVEELS